MLHEVRDSRSEIEQESRPCRRDLRLSLWSGGRAHGGLVRNQFAIGCGTRLRYSGPKDDPAVLPRVDTYYLKSAEWFRSRRSESPPKLHRSPAHAAGSASDGVIIAIPGGETAQAFA